MSRWGGAHVLVTGGSSGIGLAFVRRVLDLGGRVSVLAQKDEHFDAADAELRGRRAAYLLEAADVSEQAQVAATVDRATAAFGPVDVLLTCAGIAHPGYFERLDDEIFRRTMEVDYFGTLYAMRAVVPSMMERRAGSVVGISSAAGLVGIFGYTPYSPPKFAVRGLLESLRCEVTPYGVHVGCVCPPDTRTPQLEYENRFKPDETRAISGQIRPISADRVAAGIVRGIERQDFLIMVDWQTRLLARTAGLLRGVYFGSFDRRVRKARQAGVTPPGGA